MDLVKAKAKPEVPGHLAAAGNRFPEGEMVRLWDALVTMETARVQHTLPRMALTATEG